MINTSKLIPVAAVGLLMMVDSGHAQELQRTVYRFQGTTASVSGSTQSACVLASLGLHAFSNATRTGGGGDVTSQSMLHISYTVTDYCAKTRMEVNADVLSPDVDLPSTLHTGSVSTSTTAVVRVCSFKIPFSCQSVRLPLTVQADWVGDPELYSTSRNRTVQRVGTQLITQNLRNRTVAAEAQVSLQIGDHTASLDTMSGYLNTEKSGSVTVDELPRDPQTP